MRHRLAILGSLLLAPAVANGQPTCAIGATNDSLLGPIYPACATDRPARLIGPLPAFKYPEVLAAAGLHPLQDPVALVIVDSSGRVGTSSVLSPPSVVHPGFHRAILQAIRDLRFIPAQRNGLAVASLDTIRLRLPRPPAPLVPRGQTHTDYELGEARQRAMHTLEQYARCARAITTVMSPYIPDSLAWVFDLAPTCPGREDAAEVAARLDAYHLTAGIGPARWREFAAQVRSPQAFAFALESARRGNRSAFAILGFQSGGGWARVADSIPVGWDVRRQTPTTSCGPIRLFLSLTSEPGTPMPDTLNLQALQLADSMVAASGVDPQVRGTAWCLAAQLR